MVKSQKTTFLCFCAFAFLFILAVVLSAYSVCQNVHDNGGGADAVRTELSAATGKLGEQAETITGAIGESQEIRGAIDAIIETERGDAELLSECRSILEAVRSRNET